MRTESTIDSDGKSQPQLSKTLHKALSVVEELYLYFKDKEARFISRKDAIRVFQKRRVMWSQKIYGHSYLLNVECILTGLGVESNVIFYAGVGLYICFYINATLETGTFPAVESRVYQLYSW